MCDPTLTVTECLCCVHRNDTPVYKEKLNTPGWDRSVSPPVWVSAEYKMPKACEGRQWALDPDLIDEDEGIIDAACEHPCGQEPQGCIDCVRTMPRLPERSEG